MSHWIISLEYVSRVGLCTSGHAPHRISAVHMWPNLKEPCITLLSLIGPCGNCNYPSKQCDIIKWFGDKDFRIDGGHVGVIALFFSFFLMLYSPLQSLSRPSSVLLLVNLTSFLPPFWSSSRPPSLCSSSVSSISLLSLYARKVFVS